MKIIQGVQCMKGIRRYAVWGILLVSLVLFPGCGTESNNVNYTAAIEEGREAVREIMEEIGAPSVSVALVDGERVIWAEAFGVADREAGLAATPQTLYGACSISKIIATVAAMILVDQGKLSLDEPITTYLRDFSMPLDERYRNITLRMLVNHSSGLPGYEPGSVSTLPFPEYASRMQEEMIYQRLVYHPGSISAYNNEGFTMVENLVKAVTGESYPDFVRRNIFEPLGMGSSQYQNLPLPEESCARAYEGETVWPLYCFNVYASGGLFCTAEELARVGMMLLNQGMHGTNRVLSEASVAAMGENQRLGTFDPVPCEESRYGLGWDTVVQPALGAVGIRGWQKAGDIPGMYGTIMVVLPEEKLGAVVFGAAGSMEKTFASSHAMKIANRILLRALVERGSLSEMPDPLSEDPLPILEVPGEDRANYPGVYASSFGICGLRYQEDDSITLQGFDGTDWTPLYENFKLRSDGWYAADDDPVTALKLLTASGRRYVALRRPGVSPHYSFSTLIGERLDENAPPMASVWEARLGETWLPVNMDLSLGYPEKNTAPGMQLGALPDLEGYLRGNQILTQMIPPSESRLDGKFLIVPDNVRGMEDAAMEIWNGQEWMRLGSYLYRPLSEVPLLEEGERGVSISSQGFGEWFRLPSSGELSISGSTFWFLYDAEGREITSGTIGGTLKLSDTHAAYLLLRGEPETAIALNLTRAVLVVM